MVSIPTTIPGLTLRPWRKTDAPLLAKLGDNPNIARNIRDSFPQPYTLESAHQWIHHALTSDEAPYLYVIALNDQFIGAMGAHPYQDIFRHTAEVGYWMGEPHWGKGYGTAALAAFTGYLFANTPFVRLEAGVFPFAAGSARILEKAGWHLEVINRNRACKDGVIYDRHLYVKLKT